MRQELSLEIVEVPGVDLLSRITAVLGTSSRPPEFLVWSNVSGTNESRVWIVVDEPEVKICELISAFELTAGVRRVFLHGPGQGVLQALGQSRQ